MIFQSLKLECFNFLFVKLVVVFGVELGHRLRSKLWDSCKINQPLKAHFSQRYTSRAEWKTFELGLKETP